ncbi:MAG: hypothetical protein GY754_35845 [bacterium]|nr:hypothetical protein [bacterium]
MSNHYGFVLKIFFFHVVLPLFIAVFIYLSFRTESLLVFSWLDFLGLKELTLDVRNSLFFTRNYFPAFVLYSLPDGLWVYSAVFAFVLCWRGYSVNLYVKYFWMILPFILGVLTEVLQLLHVIAGVFCVYDMTAIVLCYSLAMFVYYKYYQLDKEEICHDKKIFI